MDTNCPARNPRYRAASWSYLSPYANVSDRRSPQQREGAPLAVDAVLPRRERHVASPAGAALPDRRLGTKETLGLRPWRAYAGRRQITPEEKTRNAEQHSRPKAYGSEGREAD